jgi:hypothetical protein
MVIFVTLFWRKSANYCAFVGTKYVKLMHNRDVKFSYAPAFSSERLFNRFRRNLIWRTTELRRINVILVRICHL